MIVPTPFTGELILNSANSEWLSRQFERPSINDVEPYIIEERTASTCSIHSLITEDEVKLHRKSFSKDTASGTDRFKVVDLKSVPALLLAIMMNVFLLAKDVPEALKINRTTLLAKKAEL